MKIEISSDFRKFADNFGDYSGDDSWDESQMIGFSIEQMTDDELNGAQYYINGLLGGGFSADELNRIWDRTNARVRYHNGYVRILTLAETMIDELLKSRKARDER